jgi:hypothetical protein
MLDATVALTLLLAVAATALLVAAAATPRGFTAFALATWVVAFAEVQVIMLALSPVHAVTRPGCALCEVLLLGLALAVWHRRGRPRPPRPDLGFLLQHPTLLVLAAGVTVAFVYEAFIGIAVPPNNWDSLTYHLARAAAWYRQGDVHWIANAPTERQNAFPAGSELANLWSFVVADSDRLAAAAQLFAAAATSAGIFGVAVRLGFARPAAAFAALLFPTLAVVALESTTTQNDLTVASLVIAAAFFILDGDEAPHAGVAFALALCVKLTAVLAVPGLVLLALVARMSTRRVGALLLSFLAAFAVLGVWLYAENVANTGLPLGHGGGRTEHSPHLSALGWLATVIRILYRFLDLTGVPSLGLGFWGSSTVLAVLLVVVVATRRLRWRAVVTAGTTVVAIPLSVTVVAAAAKLALTRMHFEISPAGTSEASFSWAVSHHAHEDFSYFGPLGLVLVVLIGSSLRHRNGDTARRALALAGSFLLFIGGVAATYRFNDFLGRFMLVPVALATPLFATVYRRRAVASGLTALALAVLALTLAGNELKPAKDQPWSLSRADAIGLLRWQPRIADGIRALERAVPRDGCVDALLGGDEPAYLLFGPHLARHVSYVSSASDARGAIVIGPAEANVDLDSTWRVESLGGYWRLGVKRSAAPSAFACTSGPSGGLP